MNEPTEAVEQESNRQIRLKPLDIAVTERIKAISASTNGMVTKTALREAVAEAANAAAKAATGPQQIDALALALVEKNSQALRETRERFLRQKEAGE